MDSDKFNGHSKFEIKRSLSSLKIVKLGRFTEIEESIE